MAHPQASRGRLRLRAPLGYPLPAEASVAGLRPPTPGDALGLGALMHDAYLNTVDYAGETLEQALAEVQRTFQGAYGAFSWTCSRVIERDDAVLSAALVTREGGRPLVAFTMTAARFKRQGLARATLASAMRHLFFEGETQVDLAVTRTNLEAIGLYRSLGFVEAVSGEC